MVNCGGTVQLSGARALLCASTLKPPFEGVTGRCNWTPQNTLQLAVNHSKGCYANPYTLLILNYVIVSDFKIMKYITIPNSFAKQNKNKHILL